MTPVALQLWRGRRAPVSRWRLESIAAIGRVLNSASPELLADDTALLKAVDAAYPFGSREMFPYKMWLVERRIFRDACSVQAAAPSTDEIGACEVARDLAEESGPYPPAAALKRIYAILEMAPNRMARKCPACAALPGLNCHEGIRTLLVPHHARLVGHRDAGPLFAGAHP